MEDPAGQLGEAVARLHHALRRAAVQASGRPSMPAAQVELLRLVEQRPGISVGEAAEWLRTAPNTVSTLVGDLADAGLLERTRAADNRRIVRLSLTAAARERLDRYAEFRRTVLGAALNGLDEQASHDVLRAVPHLHRLAELLGPTR